MKGDYDKMKMMVEKPDPQVDLPGREQKVIYCTVDQCAGYIFINMIKL